MKDRYFHNPDGTRYIPMGQFACYFRAEYADEIPAIDCYHGDNLLEFQRCQRSTWHKLFAFLQKDGCTAIRMFPRGDSAGSIWEGLDLGGRLNRRLYDLICAYAHTAREYGIRLQLGLFTEPECSFYCRQGTRTHWGRRLWEEAEIKAAAPSQQRFLRDVNDIVPYDRFFSDPDVRVCCHAFLEEIIPLIRENDDIFAVEVFNEMGWASPHENPANTFRWELTPDYLDWSREMVAHIRRLAPDLPVCISNPGVGLLGHDNVQWYDAIQPDFFSLHSYPDICGALPGTDYASVSDMALKYTMLSGSVMMGEWQAAFGRPQDRDERAMALNSRDHAWLTLLSGAPGCISWCARGYGMYHAVSEVFGLLEGRDLTPALPARVVNVSEAHRWFVSLAEGGEEECRLPAHKWCPDRAATDGKHRFCVKAESEYHRRMVDIETWSLNTGADYQFSRTEGKPLLQWSAHDFADEGPVSVPEGYQQKSLTAANGKTVVVYLRNHQVLPFMAKSVDGLPVEKFSVRTQKARPVTLTLRQSGWDARLLDLDTGEWLTLIPGDNGLGVTSHDFAVVLLK